MVILTVLIGFGWCIYLYSFQLLYLGIYAIGSINSLAPDEYDSNFKSVVSKNMLYIYVKFMSTSCKISLRWMPQNTSVDNSTLVQVIAAVRKQAITWASIHQEDAVLRV